MDRLDFHVNEELLRFFHCNKTEMSCLENPHTFIRQLRDHNLVPEDKYKKITRMRSKEQLKKALYDLLDWLESERSQHIKLFWKCVFKETILSRYPVLRTLRNDLMDGSFDFGTPLPETVDKEKRGGGKQKRLHDEDDDDDDESEEEEKETKSVKQKRKLRSKSMCDNDDERNAGPWTPVTQTQKKKSKISYSPLKKRERGHLKAASYTRLCKKRLKFTNDCASTEEEDDDEEKESETDTEDEVSSATHVSEDGSEKREQVFKVTCGAVAATLHQKRFASGTRSKSIRTETCWMTPLEFAEEELGQKDVSWREVIEWEGQPLGKLTEDGILVIHSVCCDCRLCKPDKEELENQKNDDECCICKREEGLVMCDQCPRSFHQKCHLPHVDDSALGDDSTWLCTFCVFRSNEQSFYRDKQTMEAAMSRQISQHMLECQYLFLHLCCADADQTFAEDSNLYLNDYSTVVKTPMWLRKIADKLQEQRYQTVGEFVSDVDLIFTNCASYNEDDAEFLAYGNGLKELFAEEFTNVFNIQ